ncbi:MAG: serine--tRNA ligase [Spirochaetaceae bacterium]|nr:serine--tRNA ligase [Spirochaetaceae bacterium]
MIDLKLLAQRLDEVKTNVKNRFIEVDVDLVLQLYTQKNKLITQLEQLRAQRNANVAQMKSAADEGERSKLIEESKNLKDQVLRYETELEEVSARLAIEADKLPNYAHPAAPLGKEDEDAIQLKTVGELPNFDFKPLDHVELGEKLNLVNFEAGAKVTGPKFYFLKNEAVLLENALTRYALDKISAAGFELYQTPDIAREEILVGIGFNPRGPESNIYNLEGTGTCLVGTAEITLGGYYKDEIIDLSNGPLLLGGLSHCFRREAGSSGQFSKGLYRVHQFTKIEMFIFCKPEDSPAMHEKILAIEEDIFTSLSIPYRVVDTPVGALGAPAYRKYDLEAWLPGRGENGDWGEITSTSNCTDFQARRLNIRYKDSDGKNKFVHTLNGTAIAISRALVAIMELYQQADGTITMPKALVPYLGFERIETR